MVADTTYYELLGVSPAATENEIKRAYRKKAMELHPDKNPNDHLASAKFQEVAEAYEILIDPESREAYDELGLEGMDGLHGFGGGGMGMDPEDILNHLFGGMRFDSGAGPADPFGFTAGPGRRKGHGDDSVIPYEVSLEDLYNGKKAQFNIEKSVTCGTCNGSGGKPNTKPKKCTQCEGKGYTTINRAMGANQIGVGRVTCPECHGEGQKLREKDRCKKCKGEKTVKEKKKLDLYVEKGMKDKERIVLHGEGDQEPGATVPGDVIFQLHQKVHPTFERSGSDLSTVVHLNLSESLLGFSRILITHLDGRGIHVDHPTGKIIRSGDCIIIKGEGMPTHKRVDEKGDLYIRYEVDLPTDDWLKEVDVQALAKLLPAKKPDIEPRPAIVDEVNYEPADVSDFGNNDEEAWETDDEEDDGSGPQCQTQ